MQRTDVRIGDSPTRCPYCHDGIADAEIERSIVCMKCLARHHEGCWVGACASCRETKPLGIVSVSPTAPPEERSNVPFDAYEAVKRWANRGYAIAFVLHVIVTFTCLVIDSQRAPDALPPGVAGADATRPPPVAFMISNAFTCLVLLAAWAINVYDASVRRHRDGSTRVVAIVGALVSPCTGGLSGFAYYLTVGWKPLPRVRATSTSRLDPSAKGSLPDDA